MDPETAGPDRGAAAAPSRASRLGGWFERLPAWVALPLLAGAVAPLVAVSGGTSLLDPVLNDLPFAAYSLGASFLRMLCAYAMSLGFALGYGYACAASRGAERVLLPILDVLQSVPILGFFPIAIVVFYTINPYIGPDFASIFLIFTSMSWNMAFGVYESLKGLPNDLHEAGDSFGVHSRLRMTRILLPATVNRLVYNSVLSWTAGWYFLVAAEIISVNGKNKPLVGIGSYLDHAAAAGNTPQLIAGVTVLVVLIALLDTLLWRNLARWAEKYRTDTSPSGEAMGADTGAGSAAVRRVRNVIGRGLSSGVAVVSAPVHRLGTVTVARLVHRPKRTPGQGMTPLQRSVLYYGIVGTALVVAWFILIALGVTIYGLFSHPLSAASLAAIRTLPLALAYSFSRVVAAYLLSLGISLGLALFLARRPKVARYGLPVVQIVASVPATALFPLFLFSLEGRVGVEPAVVFVEMTGMVWYVFFNILSGLRQIPPDLEESARSAGLTGWKYYRRLVLPAIFPAFVTGSITAFGGGWNTLIIAEYLQAGPHTISVLGLGQLIDISVLVQPNSAVMVAALLTMIFAVVAVNEVLWKPLYRRAREKYKYD